MSAGNAVFVHDEAHRELGVAMADFMRAQMNRSGFVRHFFALCDFDKTNHTCPEYSRAEWEVARRIINRAKKRRALTAKPYKENLRMILREIRRTNYQ